MKSLQDISYKTLFTILFFSLAGIIFFLRIGKPANKVSAAWWDEMWHYRKAISITNSSGSNLTDFQVSISIGTSQLVAEGKMQIDCDDIRITDINGNLLPHWTEPTGPNSCNQTTDTKIWVKATSLPTSGSTIYFYYGNFSAISASSGINTFIYFKNNFQASDLGWNWSNGGVENGWAKTWSNSYDSPGSTMAWIKNIINITGQEVIVEFSTKLTKISSTSHNTTNVLFNPTSTTSLYTNTSSSNITNASGNSLINFGDYSTWYGRVGFDTTYGQGNNITNDTSYPLYAFNTDGWVRHVHKLTNSSLMLSGYSIGGLDVGGSAWAYNEKTITSGYTKPNTIILAIGEHTYDPTYLREVFVRKYASTEPTPIFQSEELSPAPIAYWKFDEGTGATAYDTMGTINGNIINATYNTEDLCISGKCLYFNGSAYVNTNFGVNRDISVEPLSISMWVKPTSSGNYMFLSPNQGTNQRFYFATYNGKWDMGIQNSSWGGGTISVELDKWAHIEIVANGATVYMYVNQKLTRQINYTSYVFPENIAVGQHGSSTNYRFIGYIDEVKIYPYARTADQIKQDYNSRGSLSGSSVNLGVRSNTAPSIKSALVAYWKFDENNGTTTYDSSGYNNTGILFGAKWTLVKNGIGLSLGGYGSNNYIGITQTAIDNDTTWSVSTKLKYINLSKTFEFFLGKTDQSTGKILLRHNGYISFRATNGTYYNFSTTSAEIHNIDNTLTFVSDGTTINLYIDGIYKSSVTPASTSFSVNTIGNAWTDTVWTTALFIDEIKIYNRALTPEEIKQDYNQGSAVQFGATNQTIGNTTTSLEYCIPGDTSHCAPPIAEYKFDEGIGISAVDTSGNNLNAGFSGSPTWVQGKVGKALNFSGSNNLTNNSKIISNGSGLSFGVWIKTNSVDSDANYAGNAAQNIIGDTDGGSVSFGFGVHGGKVRYTQYAGSWQNVTGNISVNDNLWHYISVTHNQSNGNIVIYVDGRQDITGNITYSESNRFDVIARGYAGDFFTGQLDHFRIYNYPRTPAQIAYDYNKGSPIGWWKLDECQGNIAYDWSGIGNTGVINIGSSGTQNSLGTCAVGTSAAWTNGATGKVNSSLNFDGVDDYVSLPLITNYIYPITLTAWFKSSSLNQTRAAIISNGNDGSNGYEILQGDDTPDNNLYVLFPAVAWINTNYSLAINTWYHVVTTIAYESYTTVRVKIYVNGNIIHNGVNNNPITPTTGTRIGAEISRPSRFNGQIDDVRIYNYALTSEQVKQVYNGGAVNFR